MAVSPWNLNRLLVVAGGAIVLLALLLFTGGDILAVFSPQNAPFLVGVLAAAILAFYAPAWMYLVAGILLAAFPLLLSMVFAREALLHPGAGREFQAILLLVPAWIFGLTGGIAGFVQTRRGGAPAARDLLRAPQGIFGFTLAVLVAGVFLASTLASAEVKAFVEHPADNVVADETVELHTTDATFAPRNLTIPAGKIVALRVINDDAMFHTFTYHAGDEKRETPIPAGAALTILLRFDAPQEIHFWCAPHSEGASDTSEEGMWGTLVVQ